MTETGAGEVGITLFRACFFRASHVSAGKK